jgi:hypothetical protein
MPIKKLYILKAQKLSIGYTKINRHIASGGSAISERLRVKKDALVTFPGYA